MTEAQRVEALSQFTTDELIGECSCRRSVLFGGTQKSIGIGIHDRDDRTAVVSEEVIRGGWTAERWGDDLHLWISFSVVAAAVIGCLPKWVRLCGAQNRRLLCSVLSGVHG